MFDIVKRRCGIASNVTVYDDDILLYMEDCKADMMASGVSEAVFACCTPEVITAVTFYVKAHLGDDRSDTEEYMDLYRKKVFRLTLWG